MTKPAPGLWDNSTGPDLKALSASVDQLAGIVSGNDHLVAEPGLVQALVQNNATPQQSQAINQFVGGLKAEQAVRIASQAGTKIHLDFDQQQALDAMGIKYDSVIETPQDAAQKLTAQMAAQGVKPVLDANGQPKVDANGNPLVQKIEAPAKKRSGFGRFFHDITNNPLTSLVMDGTIDTNAPSLGGNGPGLKGVAQGLNAAYTFANTEVSQQLNAATHPNDAIASLTAQTGGTFSPEDQALASRLGYDSSSFMSMQAYKARGYAHTDTSHIQADWDRQNPTGLNGWDGKAAVTEAEVFATDPQKYRSQIENDQTLTPEQAAAKLAVINSKPFQEVVGRVNAQKADIGTDFARGSGIDPLKHPLAFSLTAASTNVLASFFLDPSVSVLSAVRDVKVGSTAVKSFADQEGILRALSPADGVPTTVAQGHVMANVHDMVNSAKAIREASAAGDTVAVAKIKARLDAANPFAGLLSDFTGDNQILRVLDDTEYQGAKLAKGELPFVYGKAAPIETYDDAVQYMASKNALMRLQGGRAPVEATYMPGTLSSFGYKQLRGSLASWSAGRSASKALEAEGKFLRFAADPARAGKMIDEGMLTRFVPQADDAVDVLSGHAISVPASQAGLKSAARGERLALTDAARGQIRRNQLDTGTVLAAQNPVSKVLGWSTLGMAQRAKLAAARFTNWIPRDTEINLLDASAGDAVKKTALTYLSKGDANLLAARWDLADGGGRKAIVTGLKEQIAHAAGLTRTKAGRDLITRWKSEFEHYATNGQGVVDANGTESALFPGQVQEHFRLPNFGSVHQASAKVGIYEATMGRLMSSWHFNALLSQWKLGALATPVTALRASIESWIAAAADGQFVRGLQAKALLNEQGRLAGLDVYRTKAGEALANLPVLQGLGRFYRHALISVTPENVQQAVLELPDDLLHAYVHEQAALHYALNLDPANINERTEAALAGFAARKVTYDTKAGWSEALKTRLGYELTDELDGMRGVRTYAHNLAIRVNKSPDVARAMLDRIENPSEFAAGDVVEALDSTAQRAMSHTQFGKVYWTEDGKQVAAATADEVKLGKEQWAERMTEEFRGLLTGRNGRLNTKLTGYIRLKGEAPSEDWLLDNAKKLDRPEKMLAPVFQAVPSESGAKAFVENILDREGKGYQWLVERPIQRHVTSPLFTAAYADAKIGLADFKTALMKGGLPEEAAEHATANAAASQAWTRIARMVDDPGMRSQMDIAGRGFFAFSRATTMMIRRWGDIGWRNPAAARRLMLAVEGASHSGLVYKDENGQWDFHFPASGVAQEALFHAASHIPGLQGLVNMKASDFTGRVTSIIPGSSNPFQYSTTPMISIAGRKIASFFPNHREVFDEIDHALNGSQGQGQGILATLTPTPLKRFTDAMNGDERNSLMASAMVGSLFNLYAAGKVPPETASPSEWDAFYTHLKQGTKSQLFLRALTGMFSPATIAVPDNRNSASKPDFAFAQSGAQGLRDEFKRMLTDTHGDYARATAIFTALHPEMTVYMQSASHATSSKALLPATQSALDWMNRNGAFMDKYKSVAAYFLPPQKAGEPYSQGAYRAQLETGLRQRKTPEEFYNQTRIATDGNEYYAMKDQFQAEIDKGNAEGNSAYAKARQDQWLAWSKDFKAQHPIFATNLDSGSAVRRNEAAAQLNDLRSMVKNGDAPGGAGEALGGLIQAYDGYKAFLDQHPGGSNLDRAAKTQAFGQLQQYMEAVVQAQPQLEGVYRAVFRTLNSNLANLAVSISQ
jgi:hypothetical protein